MVRQKSNVKKDPEALKPRKDPLTNRYADGMHIWAAQGGVWREAEILHARKVSSSSSSGGGGTNGSSNSNNGSESKTETTETTTTTTTPQQQSWQYYVHWLDLNRRMDAWVEEKSLAEVHPENPKIELKLESGDAIAVEKEKSRRVVGSSGDHNNVTDLVEFVEEDYGELASMDAQAIMEHEAVTKIKNVSHIQLGRHKFETWYYSPIPREYFAADSVVDTLYFCEFSLDFFLHEEELARHYKNHCALRYPPGNEVYRDEETRLAMFEVDGVKSRFYAQNLCYLAKFFLDHKTLHFDTEPFLFYVLLEFDEYGYHVVGFFSKEKLSEAGYNLACILTLPPYQKRGYGTFLISFSYELSKKEQKVGSPEKPLSDLGQISYRSYWSKVLVEELQTMLQENRELSTVSVMDITLRTAIRNEDVISTLHHLGLLKELVPDDLGSLRLDLSGLAACAAKLNASEKSAPRVKPQLIHFAPLKVDVKKDRWMMAGKMRKLNNAAASAGGGGG